MAGLSSLVLWAAAAGSSPQAKVAEYSTPVAGREADQRHNAWLALREIRGTVIPPGGVFSFNQTVGSWSRDKGYRRAPVSFNGSLIDAWGGGVCQTSTTLYNAALLGGLEVLERHPHHFAPSYVAPGRDAAVAYPAIDLRVRNPYPVPLIIEGEIENDRLVVRFTGRLAAPKGIAVQTVTLSRTQPKHLEIGVGPSGRVRSPGKPGWQVETLRIWPGRRELVSRDSYPVMHRVLERM